MSHFEGAAEPAKRLNKFLQDGRNAFPYVLYECRLSIQDTRSGTFAIHQDISHMKRTKDLRARGATTVLVKESEASIRLTNERSFTGMYTF